jgi:hypothetical protein
VRRSDSERRRGNEMLRAVMCTVHTTTTRALIFGYEYKL